MNNLADLQLAYYHCFAEQQNEAQKTVLKDLENFCRYNHRLTDSDSLSKDELLLNEGKRQVYLRILKFIEAGKKRKEGGL